MFFNDKKASTASAFIVATQKKQNDAANRKLFKSNDWEIQMVNYAVIDGHTSQYAEQESNKK